MRFPPLTQILDRQRKHSPQRPLETVQSDDDIEANEEQAAIEIEMAAAMVAPIEMVATQTAPRQRLNSKLFCKGDFPTPTRTHLLTEST
jgi:hypothetical protein